MRKPHSYSSEIMISDNKSEIIIYQTKDGKTVLEVNLKKEMVWLSQVQMCQLFEKNRHTIFEQQHI